MSDEPDQTRRKTNRLGSTGSPYLLQHAENPVDWYPWGDEAFQRARDTDKPIFLSIGYATCHWCHVMAHESFEDEEVASLLNQHFVSIKVDREERPDIDQIYMSVCQSLTGHGGWPLSIFMTPEAKPFYAGTYFPKRGRMGMPGFMDIVGGLATLWKQERTRLLESVDTVTRALQSPGQGDEHGVELGTATLKHGFEQFRKSFDSRWGGFGSAPKFPTPHNLSFLLRWYKRSGENAALHMVEKTLEHMRAGGIFDHIGGGFHRYSVDARWLVPHFEKMLYDQALLAIAAIESYQVTKKDRYGSVTREIFAYVLRDMTAPEGGFYSAEDADSEGEEGRFYVWTPEEVKDCLGQEHGDLFNRFYHITEEGNFEHGRSIPHTTESLESFGQREGIPNDTLQRLLQESLTRLFERRDQRIHPLKDDKILTAWNGLMIAAMALGHQALGAAEYAEAARKSADFILGTMRKHNGRLYRRYRNGDVAIPGFLEDYAFLVWGLIELYQATFELAFLEEAIRINRETIDLFWDEEGAGFVFTGRDSERLIAPGKDIYDGAIPSGNSVALMNLLRLGRITGDTRLEERAERLVAAFSSTVASYPMGYTQFLIGLDFMIGPTQEIVIVGDLAKEMTREMVSSVHRAFLPGSVLLLRGERPQQEGLVQLAPYVKEMKPMGDQPTAYWCENFTCKKPITDITELRNQVAG